METLSASNDPSSRRSVLPLEVDALLDYRGGLAHYHRDDAWTEAVTRHFEFNVDRMARMAGVRGIPMVLVEPVTNLRDCPPFKFEINSRLDAGDRRVFEELWDAARSESEPELAVGLLRQALDVDPRHAGAHYALAKRYESMGRIEEARRHFLRAKDEDICPLRIREPMYEALERVARSHRHLRLIDIRPLFEEMSAWGIPGDDVMADHVHPHIEGHQKMALRLLSELESLGVVHPIAGWDARRKAAFQTWIESLDEVYFARGKMRLEGLRSWSQGRALKVAPREAPPDDQRPSKARL